MLGNRQSQHTFAQAPQVGIQRSSFNRSSAAKDTMEFDALNPIYVDEILPGDTINLRMELFGRLATPFVPIMDNMYVDIFFFFVPNRLVWENWERFCGAQDDPDDSTDFLIPQINGIAGVGYGVGSIYDHMGIPPNTPDLPVNALPLRAYNLIWNTWFRDQNLQNSLDVPKGNGPDAAGIYGLQNRGKRHDYFTSALPWPQKGEDVTIPFNVPANLNVISNGLTPTFTTTSVSNRPMQSAAVSGNNVLGFGGAIVGSTLPTQFGNQSGLHVPTTNVFTGTINELREAFQMQALFELDARGGTRYVELLRSHFQVVSPDFRLQRPEYLGGGQSRINTHPIAATAASADGNLADLGAIGTVSAINSNIGFTHSFVEHGFVIGLASARADLTYQHGLNRMWSRRTRWDHFWPLLENLGEQAILNKEIFATGNAANDNGVFGYQERNADYKYKPSEIRGFFRSDVAESLDIWHQAEEFGSTPQLSNIFIQSSTPIKRSIRVNDEPALLMDMFFKVNHARPMKTYSVPASLGRM